MRVFLASLAAVTSTLLIVTTPSVGADAPCVGKAPKTELVKKACSTGGQKAAKDAMKAFNKAHKIKSCNQCHTKLAPGYELKPDAYDQFKKLGGT